MTNGSPRPFGSSTIATGTVLDGKYEILDLIGSGGMGEVFKARHLHLNAFRCIKVMKQGLLADDMYRTRFLREARLATQIHHPNIAAVHDFFLGDGGSYMVTEFIDGTTVRDWISSNGVFPLALAADVAAQVLAGLGHIHRRALLHRDISAGNIMLSYDSDDCLVVKIIDLGIAKETGASSADTTQIGMLMGNPKYMSPEQLGRLADGEQIDGRADLYCLGVVLYEMLLGVPPFTSQTTHGYIMKHLTEAAQPFAAAAPELEWPEGLEAVVFKALEKDRSQRYADARDFSNALRPYLSAPAGTLTRSQVEQLRGAGTIGATIIQAMPPGTDTPTEAGERERLESSDAIEKPAARSEAASREQSDGFLDRAASFQRAWEDGSSAAWRRYLESYGASAEASRAQSLLEEALAFEGTAGADTETELREFLKSWPDGRHRLEAEIRLNDLRQRLSAAAFSEAVAADTYAAIRDFATRFPASMHSDEAARVAAERLAFETAAAVDTEDSWESYLAQWGKDRHAAAARQRCEEVRAREESDYRAASESKTVAAWDAFLAQHPYGRRKPRAELHRREALAFDSARGGGRQALETFLRMHPAGLLAREARRLVRELADEDDYKHACSLDRAAAWQLYLMTHPGGAHAEEVRGRLAAIEDAAFVAITASKDPKAGAAFLTDFPDSPRRDEMTRLVARWEEVRAATAALDAIAKGDCDAAELLLGSIGDGEEKREIAAALDAARDKEIWEHAAAADSVASLRRYLEIRPQGRWGSNARRRLSVLEAAVAEAEPRDWAAAWEAGTAAAWDRYLADHSNSARAAEANLCRREASDFELASTTNEARLWRAFLKAWPDGRHRLDAELRLRQGGR
ncbi:MAG TPA: serine/threonine-protein kinase [Thermoanaerobaculia bacterium]|nr:serine/threonine-protein kinase [Thermoanaerobaculia bacterium]